MKSYKYEQVADDIRNLIIKENYKHKLPTEIELINKYNVSRITIKKAINLLKNEELIYTIQGGGIFVNSLKKSVLISNYQKKNYGFTHEHLGINYKTVVLDFEIRECPNYVAIFLNLKPTDKVYIIKRLRIIENTPDRYEITYIPVSIIKGLTPEICEKSIYEYITDDLKLKISKTHDYFFTSYCSNVDKSYLKLKNDSIIINLEQIGFLSTGEKFQYSITKYKHESFTFKSITNFE